MKSYEVVRIGRNTKINEHKTQTLFHALDLLLGITLLRLGRPMLYQLSYPRRKLKSFILALLRAILKALLKEPMGLRLHGRKYEDYRDVSFASVGAGKFPGLRESLFSSAL